MVRAGVEAALDAAAHVLGAGGGAVAAVVAAVCELEDCPALNAGIGSVLNSAGEVEMDACVMAGVDRAVGAVAGLRRVRHAVLAAEAVRRDGRHVLLAGEGAERFTATAGLEAIAPEALVTEFRRGQLVRFHERAPDPGGGTVGAVARDAQGHLAAATSTGGMVGKLPGRISDSALAGAGTWADDRTCALSATGHGEPFIRAAFAHRVDGLMREARLDLESACAKALAEVAALGGAGGCVAVDAAGRVALPYDTGAMPRGVAREAGSRLVVVYPD